MTDVEVVQLARVIKTRDALIDWIESFQLHQNVKYQNVTMELGLRDNDGRGTGWEGEWSIDRLFAIEWFQRGLDICNETLRIAGVIRTPQPESAKPAGTEPIDNPQ